jgi:hypothetical protein
MFISCRKELQQSNMQFLSQPGTTSSIIVLTTPDAQHAMFSYQVMLLNYPSSNQNLHSTVILRTLSISGLSRLALEAQEGWEK